MHLKKAPGTAILENLELKRLSEAPILKLIELMNHPKVRAQMPLAKEYFDERDCREFIKQKDALWKKHGYGPWAFFIDNHFVGWGGIQPEMGESDLAMVLHPEYWGIGKSLLKIILEKAFDEMGKDSVIILFPNTRTRLKGIYRIGFKREKEVELNGQKFTLFRLQKKDAQ